jgi:hypothetical protein
MASVTGIGREGRCAARVIDAQVVLIPVATMFAQPCCLELCERGACIGCGEHTGIGPMKKRLDVR